VGKERINPMYFLDEFEKQAAVNGDSAALTDHDGKRSCTYGQLDSLSDMIAGRLTARGIKPGSSVIIILPRTIEYIACEIALLKIGAVVVPLIPEYPQDRVDFIEKDSSAVFIIRESFFDGTEPSSGEAAKPSEISDDERGMIIYTSGSTGRPKGVVYTRSNIDAEIIRTTEGLRDISPFVFAASATMSFCVTVTEYLRTLAVGGHVHIISNEVRSDARRLSDYYKENRITAGFISPRILKGFSCKSECLKRVLTASEKVVNIYSPDFEIVNAYGQSETVGIITGFMIDKLYDNTPIGKPLQGIEMIVVNQDGEEVPDGQEGEICIIGNLPCEYNNLREETERVFKKLPDGRTYIHSGDIGKKLPDGNVQYLNRNDWMIKIHGQRVEPGEIESVMNTVDGITGSVVKAFENEDGTMLLCGFYTGGKSVEREQIVQKLKAALPAYMIPGVFVRMDAFPVNANGKTDRKSRERPDLSRQTSEYEEPVGETEEALCNAMQEILNIKKIGRYDNFFELGGNSLNAVALCSVCGIEGIAPQIVMIGQTPEKIARLISEKNFYPKPQLMVSDELKKVYPLSISQKYQYEVCRRKGKTIDCIDVVYFFRLNEDIDIAKLKKSVEDVINAHVIYRSHIDIDNGQLLTDQTAYKVEDLCLKESEFESWRKSKYTRVRNLKTDPLFEAKMLHIDNGSTYLFMCLCHLAYDGKSLKNVFEEISSRYIETPVEAEQASVFDLIDQECRIREDKGLIEKAQQVFASNYEGLKDPALFDTEKTYSTGVSIRMLEKESETEIDDFLKNHGISILTLFQAAAEITIKEMFKADDFCYMNVHDGRSHQLLDASHGVFARSVFMRSGAGKYDSTAEYFRRIEEQYQRLVYYDVLDTFETVAKHPGIMSGITFNFRDMQGIMLRLGKKMLLSDFLDEINTVYKPFTDFDFIVNRLPKGYGYLVTVASVKVSGDFAEDFIKCFAGTILGILHGKNAEGGNRGEE